MLNPSPRSPRPLPVWLQSLGTALAVGHLLAIGLLALAAPSGPWLMSDGRPSAAIGPTFATFITENVSMPYYLQPLRMTHNYHFESDRPVGLGIYFEAVLKDENGIPYRTLRFPDATANFWVRHRQTLLAQGLGNDQFLAPRGADPIAAKDKELPKVEYWDRIDKENLKLKEVVILDIKHDRQYERPSDTAKALAQAYTRYLCQKHNAASVELIRHHQNALRPEKLIMGTQPDDFLVTKSHFGEYRRER